MACAHHRHRDSAGDGRPDESTDEMVLAAALGGLFVAVGSTVVAASGVTVDGTPTT